MKNIERHNYCVTASAWEYAMKNNLGPQVTWGTQVWLDFTRWLVQETPRNETSFTFVNPLEKTTMKNDKNTLTLEQLRYISHALVLAEGALQCDDESMREMVRRIPVIRARKMLNEVLWDSNNNPNYNEKEAWKLIFEDFRHQNNAGDPSGDEISDVTHDLTGE